MAVKDNTINNNKNNAKKSQQLSISFLKNLDLNLILFQAINIALFYIFLYKPFIYVSKGKEEIGRFMF